MPMHRKGPPTDVLASEYEAGATTVELGAKYEMTPAAVNGRLRRAGVAIRSARARALYDDPAVSARIVSAYRRGAPMVEIADDLGVGHATIQRALAAAGVQARPHGLRAISIAVPSNPFAIGYIAGLLDGEGNLQMRTKHRGRSVSCKMTIYSTTAAPLRWLHSTVGGKVRWDTNRTVKRGWKPIGTWCLYRAQDVATLLRVLLPHLKIKDKQARAMLRLCGERFALHDSHPAMTQEIAG